MPLPCNYHNHLHLESHFQCEWYCISPVSNCPCNRPRVQLWLSIFVVLLLFGMRHECIQGPWNYACMWSSFLVMGLQCYRLGTYRPGLLAWSWWELVWHLKCQGFTISSFLTIFRTCYVRTQKRRYRKKVMRGSVLWARWKETFLRMSNTRCIFLSKMLLETQNIIL